MLRHTIRLAWLISLGTLWSLSAGAQTPTITADGIRNGASYTVAGLPNSGIAQGSIFVIFGDNLGPATLVQVSSLPLPTSGGLAGTSVRVTVGITTVDAIMLYTLKTQVAAVLPSNTPVGTGTVTVTYNTFVSATAPITVLPGSFGTFTRNQGGTGPSILQNFNSQASQPFNSLFESARPGQVVTLWGTGLGPVLGNEAGQPLPGNMFNVDVRVFVGGREAVIDYRGRSGCCVGIDQIVFRVPQGATGCHVPVAVQVGNIMSNYTSMSIAENGGTCSSPGSYTAAELERARASGGLRIGSVALLKTHSRFTVPGTGVFESKIDSGSAAFLRLTLDEILAQDGSARALNPGACAVSVRRITDGAPVEPPRPTGLNAGPIISVSGPGGQRQMEATPSLPGYYSAQFSQATPISFEPDYIVPGAYTFTGNGGSAVGPFTATLTVPATLSWANEPGVSVIDRATGQLVTWSGGDPNGFTYIIGGSTNAAGNAIASFVCYERTTAGQFTIPSAVLLALPQTGSQGGLPTGTLAIGAATNPTSFAAPGLDLGLAIYTATTAKVVAYR